MSEWLNLKEKGNSEFQKGNYKEAIDFYTEAIKLNSEQEVLYSNRALCNIQLKDLKQAEADLVIAIEKNSMNLKANKRLGNILILKGKFKEAKLYYDRCEVISPEKDKDNHKKDSQFLESLIEKDYLIKQAYNNKDFQKVIILGKEVVSYCTNYYDLKIKYTESLIRENLIQGIDYLKNNFTNEEKLKEDTVFVTALAYYYEGKYDKSKSLLTSLISTTKTNKNKYETLLSILSSIEAVKSSANKAFTNGEYDLAVEKYLLILNVDKSNHNLLSTIYSNIALCKQKRHKLSDALHFINLAIEKNPNYLKAYYRRGLIHMSLDSLENAKKDFNRVLEIDPFFKEAKLKLEEIDTESEKKKVKDYYKILDISASANEKEVRQAYKKLAAKYHPDKNSHDKKLLEEAARKFDEIQEAYEILGSTQKRNIYDAGRDVNDYMGEFDYTERFFKTDDEILNQRAQDIYYKKNKK